MFFLGSSLFIVAREKRVNLFDSLHPYQINIKNRYFFYKNTSYIVFYIYTQMVCYLITYIKAGEYQHSWACFY